MGDTVVSLAQLEDELKRLVGKYHAQAAYLFGSYARSEAHPDSDLDVLIVGGPDFHAPNVFAIAEELHLRFQKPVDVYEIREIERESLFTAPSCGTGCAWHGQRRRLPPRRHPAHGI